MEAITDPEKCRICSAIGERAYAFQKGGREDEATYLPSVAIELELVQDLAPGGVELPGLPVSLPSSRLRQIRRCPLCNTRYLMETDYEFLAGGSEDEQRLTRLTYGQETDEPKEGG